MIEPKFYLKRSKSETPTRVYAAIRYEGNLVKYYIPGISILPSKWDFQRQRARLEKHNIEHTRINNQIEHIAQFARTRFLEYLAENRIPSPEELKRDLQNNIDTSKLKISFLDFAESYIKEQENKVGIRQIKNYGTALSHLKAFQKKYNYPLFFEDIDFSFYSYFLDYLFIDNKAASSSAAKIISILKAFMNEALKRKLHKNLAFKDFKKPSYKKKNQYLNKIELQQIYNLKEIPGYLERIKDLFLFACSTGLRYSDFTEVKPQNITTLSGKMVLVTTTRKTKTRIVVPLNSWCMEIVEKYNYKLPIKISNQKFNDYIKELCQLAGINNEVEVVTERGTNTDRSFKPKFQTITSHTARRSFATNAFLAGVPTISIMKITGHQSESAFMQYICITEDENAELMAQHDFFK